MNKKQEEKRVLRAVFSSLDSTVDVLKTTIEEVEADNNLTKDYKSGVIDATATIHDTLVDILKHMQTAMKKLYKDEMSPEGDCDCENCRQRRDLVDQIAAETGASKESMDAAIQKAIAKAKASGKVAGAIRVNKITGEVEILDDVELSAEMKSQIEDLNNSGEGVRRFTGKLAANEVVSDLIKDLFNDTYSKSEFSDELKRITREKVQRILAKMDKPNC